MKLANILSLTETNTVVIDKATNERLNTYYLGKKMFALEVLELSAEDGDIIIYVDADNKKAVFTQDEQITLSLYDTIFGSCNTWGFDNEDYNWFINGIDTPNHGYRFDSKSAMLATMEADIKEVLYNECRNGDLKAFAEDFELNAL